MKIVKKQIVTFLVVMISVIMMHRYCFAEAYDATKVEELSVAQFWAKFKGYKKSEKKVAEQISCGREICRQDKDKCVVKTVKKEGINIGAVCGSVYYIGNSDKKVLGCLKDEYYIVPDSATSITFYDYRCYDKNKNPPSGYTEASEGPFVSKQQITIEGGWIDEAESGCSEDSKGNRYCLFVNEKGNNLKNATAEYDRKDTAFRGCEVIPVKLYNNRRCFFCPLITIMYAASNHITSLSFKIFAMPFAVVMALGLAIWIAVKVLGFVSSISKQDAPKFLTELMKQSYKVMIAFFLLIYSTQIFQYIIIPVIEAGLAFGAEIVKAAGERGMEGAPVNSEILSLEYEDAEKMNLQKLEDLSPGLPNRLASSTLAKTKGVFYDKNLYIKIDSFIVFVQKNIAFMQSVGTSILCVGGNAVIWKGNTITWGDGFQLVLMGLLLSAFAFLLIIAFSFYLVDAIVQLGIVGALLPFMIATWPFKISSKYSKIGWNMILNSAFVFLFSGMVVTVDLALVNSALTYTANNGKNKVVASDGKEIKSGSLYHIASAINAQNEDEVVNLTDISSTGFLILLFCCIYGFQFMGKASELAGKFAGGALKPIAPGIATMAGSAAKSLALKSTQHAREAVSEKIKDTGKAAWGGVKSVFKGSKGENAAGADETAAAMSSNREDASNGASSRTRSTIANANAKLKNSPVISEGTAKSKPVISEDSNHGEKDVSKSRAEENFSEGNNEDNKKENTQKSSQTNADMTNAKGSSRYVEQAKKKYDRFNKPKKNPKSSKKNRKPIKTNKRRK